MFLLPDGRARRGDSAFPEVGSRDKSHSDIRRVGSATGAKTPTNSQTARFVDAINIQKIDACTKSRLSSSLHWHPLHSPIPHSPIPLFPYSPVLPFPLLLRLSVSPFLHSPRASQELARTCQGASALAAGNCQFLRLWATPRRHVHTSLRPHARMHSRPHARTHALLAWMQGMCRPAAST
jgi:hypothetical protein